MPTFYINIRNGDGLELDEEGFDLSTLDAARIVAIRTGADIIADELKSGCQTVNVTLYIEDAGHNPLMEVPMTGSVRE